MMICETSGAELDMKSRAVLETRREGRDARPARVNMAETGQVREGRRQLSQVGVVVYENHFNRVQVQHGVGHPHQERQHEHEEQHGDGGVAEELPELEADDQGQTEDRADRLRRRDPARDGRARLVLTLTSATSA